MYGFLIGISIIFSSFFAEKFLLVKTVSKNLFYSYLIGLVFASIFGARVYHVLDNFQFYSNNFYTIFNVKAGGLGVFGALFFGALYTYFFAKIKNIKPLFLYDLVLFVFPFIAIFGRLGNYFNFELYGKPTNSFFKVYIPKNYRYEGLEQFEYFHPVFFYEIVLLLILFILFLILKFTFKKALGLGLYTNLFLMFYGFIRIAIEPFRNPQTSMYLFNTNLTYVLSALLMLFAIINLTGLTNKFKLFK